MSKKIKEEEKDLIYCQSCNKEITIDEQKDVIGLYFAKQFDEFYCSKCANERHEYLISRHVD